MLGVHQTTVKNWLDGKTEPKFDMIEKIASALEITTNDLLTEQMKQDRTKRAHELTENIKENFKKYNESITEANNLFNELSNDDICIIVKKHPKEAEKRILQMFNGVSVQDKANIFKYILNVYLDSILNMYISTPNEDEE